MEPKFEVLPPGSRLPPTKPPARGGIWGVVAAVGAVLFKFALPAFVYLKAGLSVLFSVGAFMIFGWSWEAAGGIVFLIFVHEMGHFIAAKAYGIPVSAPMFVPFMGAYVLLKSRPLDPWTNAIISYAGPLAGGLGGWACYMSAFALGWPWLVAVAYYTFFINLLNLAPIPSFDGSFIWVAFSPKRTPGMSLAGRIWIGILLAGLIAAMGAGAWLCWLSNSAANF